MNSPRSRSTLIAALVAVVLALFPVIPGLSSAAAAPAKGYWFVAADGGIFSYGDADFYGSTGNLKLNQPIVGMAPTPTGRGYWFVAADGGIFSFGDAKFLGSAGNLKLNRPIVGMAPTPTGRGYWFVAADGGIFSYGDAKFFGSTGNIKLNKPIVGMAATPSGLGYWFVASDGGIFSYGDAKFYGSIGGLTQRSPIVGMSSSPTGRGYWLVAADGGVSPFGDAGFFGSMGGRPLTVPVVGMTPTASGAGYWLVGTDGGIFSYGDATFHGSTGAIKLNRPIVGMASVPPAKGTSAPSGGGGGGTSPTTTPGPTGGTSPTTTVTTTTPPTTPPTTVPPDPGPAPNWGPAGTTVRIDKGTAGGGAAFRPWLSANGRFIAFDTSADNVLGKNADGTNVDSNGLRDVFVYDKLNPKYTRVSVASDGSQAVGPGGANDQSQRPTLSADGRFVAFWSSATNLVAGDTNNHPDAFLHDRDTDEDGVFDEAGAISTVRVSQTAAGVEGNGPTARPVVSRDGSVVVFESEASNLIPKDGPLGLTGGDTNNVEDVFLWRRSDRSVTRVSVTDAGAEATGKSGKPSVSADGTKVAFDSAGSLAGGDSNGEVDIYIRDVVAGRTILVSASQAGAVSDKASASPQISANGAFVAFDTRATNLGPDDNDGKQDIYLKNLTTGAVSRVSIASDGTKPNASGTTPVNGADPSISADGTVIAFWSNATNLVPGDTNGFIDVFVHDTKSGATKRVSLSSTGAQGDGDSLSPAVSMDGRIVGFDSKATNFGGGTTGQDIFVHVL